MTQFTALNIAQPYPINATVPPQVLTSDTMIFWRPGE